MKLPEEVLEQFRLHGRDGGRTRAARMDPARRSLVARRAATARWIGERFGAPDFATLGLPGGAVVDRGLADLAAGRVSPESLVISLAAPRLRREGVPLGPVLKDPEEGLYHLLERDNEALAHSRYNAWLRQIVSFADSCRAVRRWKGRHAS